MSKPGVALLAGLIFLNLVGCHSQQPPTTVPINNTHPSMVSRPELNRILETEPAQPAILDGKVISGVLPHHLLAAPLLTKYLTALAEQKPKLIILVGPNHNNEGGRIITGLNDWQTPEGRMLTETKAVQALLQSGLAIRDEKVLTGEHAIASLVPLLHHYLPEAKIVPLILQHGVSLTEVDNLLNGLQPYFNKDTVLLASVDFSHYLTRPQAQENDQLSLQYMQNLDYTTLFRLNSDYLDSPAALACAFRRAEGAGITHFQVLDNTNSGVIMGNDNMETTSYFTLVFTR